MLLVWVMEMKHLEMDGNLEVEELLQLTGKDNYQAFADYLKKPEIMD
jgi:predicted chitinase